VRPVASRGGAAHRAPSPGPLRPGPLRTGVLASAAAVGAVTTGALTTLLSGGQASDTAADPAVASANPVLAASTGMLREDSMRQFKSGNTMLPVAYSLDDDTDLTEEQVAAVEKAGRLAARLADLHTREAERARIAEVVRRGGLDGWIAEALRVMGLPQSLAPSVKRIILAESGGNPLAVNTWDSNAARGTPSRGLMQTIPATFRAYVHPALADRPITDPVANITAGVRYMIDRYGMKTLAAGGRSGATGDYLGY
jgi:membrane-bound lytic murein transglycosylase MltF